MSFMYGTPLSVLLSKPAYCGVSNETGADTLSKLFTTRTFFPSGTAFAGIPALNVSDGKLSPPELYAVIL